LLKLEKHGGSCHRSSNFVTDKSKGGLGYDFEQLDCFCCTYTDRHGTNRLQNTGEIYRENKLIPYDENKDCVPMCPYSCKWGNSKWEYDCNNPRHVEQKIREKRLDWKFNEEKSCYEVGIANRFKNAKPENWEAFIETIDNTKNWIDTNGKYDPNFNKVKRSSPKKLKKLRKYLKGPEAWQEFVDDYSELTVKKSKRVPQGKIIDPVFGGTSCYKYDRVWDHNYTLTRIRPDDPQAEGWGRDEDDIIYDIGKHNVEEIVYGYCKFPICYPKFRQVPIQPSQACSGYMWTRWGEWGQCDLQCGLKGQRKRKRKCTRCGDPNEEEKPGGCKPSWVRPGISEEGLKDTDTAECSPCPSDSLVGWADWEEWSAPDSTECGTRVKQYRVRKCNDDYIEALAKEGDQERCASKDERGGVERESRSLKMPCRNDGPELAGNTEPLGKAITGPEGREFTGPKGRRMRRRRRRH